MPAPMAHVPVKPPAKVAKASEEAIPTPKSIVTAPVVAPYSGSISHPLHTGELEVPFGSGGAHNLSATAVGSPREAALRRQMIQQSLFGDRVRL